MLIAAIVILYHPENSVISNIESYLDYVDIVLAIDNSDIKISELTKRLQSNSKIIYHANETNYGIAHALNSGVEKAIQMGFQWALTMDQDSSFSPSMIECYLECMQTYSEKKSVAIFSPIHSNTHTYPNSPTCISVNRLQVMTSGNLLNLNLYQKLGGFDTRLFIDAVDHDFCLKAVASGYQIIEFSNIYLNHNLGEKTQIYQNGKYTLCNTHPPYRFYYIIRNRLYLRKRYRSTFPGLKSLWLSSIFKTMVYNLIYHDKKTLRLFHMCRGIAHYLVNRYGK